MVHSLNKQLFSLTFLLSLFLTLSLLLTLVLPISNASRTIPLKVSNILLTLSGSTTRSALRLNLALARAVTEA